MHSLLSHLSGPVSVSVRLCRHSTASAFAQRKCIFAYLKRRNLLEYKHTLNIQIVFKLGDLVLYHCWCSLFLCWILFIVARESSMPSLLPPPLPLLLLPPPEPMILCVCVSCVHMPVYIFELPAKCYRIVKSQ